MRNGSACLAIGALLVTSAMTAPAGQSSVVPTQTTGAPGRGGGPPATSGPLQAGAAAIVGRVVEAGSNAGVAGALVTLRGPTLGRGNEIFTNGAFGGPRRVVADGEGQFVFRDLPPGSYNIDTSAAGYVDGVYGQRRIIQIRRSLDLIRTVQINDTDRLVQATVEMFRKGGISGRIVDEAGEPMAGITLSVIARLADWSGPVSQVAQSTMTDDRGHYHVDVVPGDYIVGVLAATTTVPVELVEMFVNSQLEGGAASQKVIEQLTSASGILPRGIGTKIGSVRVSQYSVMNVPAVPPMSADGSAWFYPSTYHPSSLSPMGASVITVASGEEKGGIDLQLRPVPARRISGRIVGPDGPAGMFGIRLIPADPTVQRTSPATLIDVARAMSDRNGSFVFVGIAPGAYTLSATKLGAGADLTTLWVTEPINVGETDLKDVELRLKPGATISGRIVFEGTNQPDAAQMRNVILTPRGVPGSASALVAAPSVRANPNGTFTTTPVIPGLYQMVSTATVAGWTLKSITTSGQNAVDKNFELTSSGITDMVVTFTDKRSVLSGVARDADGAPGTAATIGVFPADRSLWRAPGMGSRRVQTAAPFRDGRYVFNGLPDGEYYVVAVDTPAPDFSDGQFLAKAIPFAARVTIAGGQTVAQDLKVAVIK